MGDRRLQVFYALAQHRSFLRAAQALFMSQSAVHFQIRQLEAELNTRLLERGKGVLDLTPSGRIAFDYAERILALSREMETRLAEVTDDMRGALRLGTPSGIGDQLLPALLAEFSALYPQVTVHLDIVNSAAVAEGVAAGKWDMGLVALPGPLPGLDCESCGQAELRFVCTPDHPLARSRSVSGRALKDFEAIVREPGSGCRQAAEGFLAAAGTAPDALKVVLQAGSTEALKAAAATGLGYAIVFAQAVEREVGAGSLVSLPLKPRLEQGICLVYRQGQYRSRVVATCGEFLRRRLQETLL
ncbi:MAG: LysR family transcriptional regulator [Azonexus sp.]|jgi:DNA-binding transcriptional LysR family regulator|nr:LysR family transcriptional regulator [Betaproteobacteria bacterium]MBK8917872.1 LysR family transcriptional regulator [Betaproteobacteria bacterium]MBP6037533.1 LysR family transcriptional regulator [Azonexus sp.]MBP6908106.1 LysR family transcriptional regulator [Azonexus sp.]